MRALRVAVRRTRTQGAQAIRSLQEDEMYRSLRASRTIQALRLFSQPQDATFAPRRYRSKEHMNDDRAIYHSVYRSAPELQQICNRSVTDRKMVYISHHLSFQP